MPEGPMNIATDASDYEPKAPAANPLNAAELAPGEKVAFDVPEPSDKVKELAEEIAQPSPLGSAGSFVTPAPRLTPGGSATLKALKGNRG